MEIYHFKFSVPSVKYKTFFNFCAIHQEECFLRKVISTRAYVFIFVWKPTIAYFPLLIFCPAKWTSCVPRLEKGALLPRRLVCARFYYVAHKGRALFIWDFELGKDLSSTFWSSERQLKMYFRLVPHFLPECIKAGSR